MARRMPLIAQTRPALASGAPLAVIAWAAATTALYLLAGAGAWAAGFTASGEVLGFLPDPAYAAGVSGCGAAEAVAASVLYTTAFVYEAPISTTHTITSAVMGVGATKRFSAVRWGVAKSIVTAWVLTFPMAGLAAAACYGLSHLLLEVIL